MAFLLAAQEAVDLQQRGIVTSAISFFRTIGGAVGIGLLGAMFNILTSTQSRRARSAGRAARRAARPARAARRSRRRCCRRRKRMIAGGLIWVFAGMLTVALVLWCGDAADAEGEVRARTCPPAIRSTRREQPHTGRTRCC